MRSPDTAAGAAPAQVDVLAAIPALGWLARRRSVPVLLGVPLLGAMALLLATGVRGTSVGNHNALIVLVWILWWVTLMGAVVPVASRAWCAICPIPLPGEWLQRRTLLRVRSGANPAARAGRKRIGHNLYSGLNRRWPRILSNLWLQTAGFLIFATFSAVLLTDPLASAVAIGGLLVVATVVAALYRQRSFCRYLCPVGGFLGLYSGSSILAVRCQDTAVCAACPDKGCVAGNERAWGCPWLEHPNRMVRSNACGLCLECVKACGQGNMTVVLRGPFAEHRLAGWDEAAKAVLMLGLAIAYSAIYLGPWGGLRDAANLAVHRDWTTFFGFTAGLWSFVLVVVPGLFLAAAALGRRAAGDSIGLRPAALAAAAAAVPLGLLAWIAFSVPLAFVNGSYVLATLSDPFGSGWDLFGSRDMAWTPLLPEWMPAGQALLVLVGQAAALRGGWRESLARYGDARRALQGFVPTAALVTGMSLLILWLHVA